MELVLKVVVIGGGAAGFFGAIACAEAHPQVEVILLEAARQPLAKVRISGGGRCNVTQACFEPALLVQNYPRGGKALRGAFSRFQAKDTVEWFKAHGVALKTEADGRMFPVTDDSATIVECLMRAAHKARVHVRTGVHVQRVVRQDGGFLIQVRSEQDIICDRLLLATGNSAQGYAIAQSLGHHLLPPVPSLFTFNIRDPRLQDLSGVAVSHVHLRLQAGDNASFEQTGPLLITHWGVSGPAVLKLSAWGARALHAQNYHASLRINWVPQSNPETLRQQLQAVRSQLSRKTIVANCPVMIPRRLWERLTTVVGIQEGDRWAEISNKTLNLLIQELTQGQYTIVGKGVFKDEFVTCGGVDLKQVDFKTMQSRICPGLYLAGEILDIDGITGGFNFQSAWTTGWLAGHAIAT
ncbi:MAG: NAD(P)/FAD-dependent oxidoreductase [Oscillatoriales cyanobacterium C42_A2020_001]|nr:NAD(P)/FAD-dependent oxidoreductase [Leptolyngbyaceae cyanobacterium C42_A2020_001]